MVVENVISRFDIEYKCPNCHKRLNCGVAIDEPGTHQPQVDDYSICGGCGELFVFGEEGLRAPTEDEIKEMDLTMIQKARQMRDLYEHGR